MHPRHGHYTYVLPRGGTISKGYMSTRTKDHDTNFDDLLFLVKKIQRIRNDETVIYVCVVRQIIKYAHRENIELL